MIEDECEDRHGVHDLSDAEWQLIGWRRNDWELARTPAAAKVAYPDVGAVPARVPGSVRGALLRCGVIADPTFGVQSRDSEWLEHRDWEFRRSLVDGLMTAEEAVAGVRLIVECDELDHAGAVMLGSSEIGRFRGSFTPYTFDATDAYVAGERDLRIIFTGAPDGLGQNGWSTRVRDMKPRFSYGWDWIPRLVSAGIPGQVRLRSAIPTHPRVLARLRTDYDPVSARSYLDVTLGTDGEVPDGALIEVAVSDEIVAECPASMSGMRLEVDAAPWQIAGRGDHVLHTVDIRLVADGVVLDSQRRRVGFRRIEWRMTEAAPQGADPWLCIVNGDPVFLAGINWVPIRADYADLTEADYRVRLERYRELGVVIIRVWGGSGIERPVFYDLCDELGILVWQEFPLSSSGLDNEPASDAEFISELENVAESYVERLAHHASLVLWSGGNELNIVVEPGVPGPPLDLGHPTLAALSAVVQRLDPGRRFVATSPSGPRFEVDPAEYGRGLHHDVHGPWEFTDEPGAWEAYWEADDSIMRSEVGVAGASGLDLLKRHGLTQPSTGEDLRQLWTHTSGWWLTRFDRWLDEGGDIAELPVWVQESQQRQARMIGFAARRSLERFPVCAGFLVWFGHDAFPCAVSLSLLDFDGELKPVAHAFAEVFAHAASRGEAALRPSSHKEQETRRS